MNNSRIFSDTVKMTEWVKFDKKGNKKISDRNRYIRDITEKALKLDIGANFVVSRQYCNKTFDYIGKDNMSHSFETDKNEISLPALLNMFTQCNIVLEDRQLTYYTNKLQQLTIQVLKASAAAKEYYIKDNDSNIETSRTAINDLTGEEIRIQGKVLKSTRLLVGDFSRYLDKELGERLEKQAAADLKEIRRNLENADLLDLCKPKAKKVTSEKTA